MIHRTFRFGPGAVFNELGECRSGAIFNELGECRSGERKLGWVLYRHGASLNVLGHSGSRVRSEVRVWVLSAAYVDTLFRFGNNGVSLDLITCMTTPPP